MKYWRKTLDQGNIKPNHYRVSILTERCKGCRLCIEFCPKHALHESPGYNSKGYHPAGSENSDCLNCGLCVLMCPEFAISIHEEPDGQ